jgi:hypothetical protein
MLVRDRLIEVITKAIEARPHAERLYPEAYAGHVADAILAAAGDPTATFHVRRDAPDTSKAIVDKVREGTLQAEMLRLFAVGHGVDWTDDELEQALARTHQSVSATRNTLARKGYLVDSGRRRKTRSNNDAIVWVHTGKTAPVHPVNRKD